MTSLPNTILIRLLAYFARGLPIDPTRRAQRGHRMCFSRRAYSGRFLIEWRDPDSCKLDTRPCNREGPSAPNCLRLHPLPREPFGCSFRFAPGSFPLKPSLINLKD